MIELIAAHQASFWGLLGLLLLAIEVLAFGMASGLLLFAGIGALLTGMLMVLGIVPDDRLALGVGLFGLCTLASVALLFKPLRRMQQQGQPTASDSDLVGLTFALGEALAADHPARHSFSGIEWRVELAEAAAGQQLEAGMRVRVVEVQVGCFRVVPA